MAVSVKEWFSAQELADQGLPGMPATKRGVQMIADREGWAKARSDAGTLARKRAGRGGGVEYHISLVVMTIAARAVRAAQDHAELIQRLRGGAIR